jgi:hypothetical protein
MRGFKLYGSGYRIEEKFPNELELYILVVFQRMHYVCRVIIIIIVARRSIPVDDHVGRFKYNICTYKI